MKTVHIFFGEMGSGKSHCGANYAKQQRYRFFEGDSVITPRMKERVSKFKPLTKDILYEYIHHLIMEIEDQMDDCDNLVVAQALYRDDSRIAMLRSLESFGWKVEMWWVRSPLSRNIQSLLSRDNGFKWLLYWIASKPFFQRPSHTYRTLYNVY